MSKISADLKKTIKEIKRLFDRSIDDQIIACTELLQKKIFPYGKLKTGIPVSVITELLPTIIKFMESDDYFFQIDGAYYVDTIACTPDEKTNTKLVIDAGAITKLKNLLSSAYPVVIISALHALVNIAFYFPEKMLENEVLPAIIQCLKSDNKLVSQNSTSIVKNILYRSDERVAAVFEANGVEPLIEILGSKNDGAIEGALKALLNITSCNNQHCQRVLKLGLSKSLKKLCDRLFVATKKLQVRSKAYLRTLRDNEMVKILAFNLITNITSYGEAQVDLIINDNFIPLILQQIKSGSTHEIKIESIILIENVFAAKPDFIPALVQHYNIFLFCYSNLGSKNADLVITSLTAMNNIVEKFEDRDIIRRKIQECGGPTKLSNLCKHTNEEIRRLSTVIYEFVFDVKPDPTAAAAAGSNQQEPELIDLDSEDDYTPVIETPQIGRQRKRRATPPPVGPLRRSKRFRISLEQADTNDDNNDQNNDIDDHPRNSSPDNLTPGAASTGGTNRHDHSGRQSSVGVDTVAVDGPSRLHPKAEPIPHNDDIPITPASRQSPALPVAASTNNETVQDEMKPSPARPFGNQSRLSSHNTHAVPEAASTNNGNIRDNQAERPTAVDSETTANADEIVRNGINPGKRFSADDDTSAIAPALPAASASTNNGTMPNDIPSRKPSPDTKPIITFVLPNQVTPPAPAARDDYINRDEIIKYWRPAEFLIHQYCDTLEIQFNRKDYDTFTPKIEFTQITSTSKPDAIFQPIDQTGFGCFSILLTGNEDASSAIRMKINKKFIDDLMQSGNFDEEKIINIISPPFLMKDEHFDTIAIWLKCRILVYCSVNGWKKYGSWDEENPMIPLFVLEKKEIDGKPVYCIVLTLKND